MTEILTKRQEFSHFTLNLSKKSNYLSKSYKTNKFIKKASRKIGEQWFLLTILMSEQLFLLTVETCLFSIFHSMFTDSL